MQPSLSQWDQSLEVVRQSMRCSSCEQLPKTMTPLPRLETQVGDFQHYSRTSRKSVSAFIMHPVYSQLQSENFTAPDPTFAQQHNITFDSSLHGNKGPIHASYSPFDYPGSSMDHHPKVSFNLTIRRELLGFLTRSWNSRVGGSRQR